MSESNPSAASGRPALALLRDSDWTDLVRAVSSLPEKRSKWGMDMTVAWANTELRSLVDLLALSIPRTTANAIAVHRVHMALGEAFVRVMSRSDRAGLQARSAFLSAVERNLLAGTYRAVFAKSSADVDTRYIPEVSE